ncbi:MAG: hypothetical protein WEG36_07365 [Gemmatimonadota bacterium]
MKGNRILVATLAGAIVAFVLGYLIWGLALAGFFESNAGAALNLMKEPFNLGAIALGQLAGALLLALVIQRWGEGGSAGGGAKVGAIVGFLMALSYDLTMFGSSNLMNLTATLVDPLISGVHFAVVGGVTAVALGRPAPD